MKSFQSLVVILAALIMINTSMIAGSSSSGVAEPKLSQLEQIQIGSEEERKRILGKSVLVIRCVPFLSLSLWNDRIRAAPPKSPAQRSVLYQ
jgi:hypothetical protein